MTRRAKTCAVVTPLPVIEDTHWEWWYGSDTRGDRARLHLLPDLVDDATLYRRVVDSTGRLTATAICGRRGDYSAPGIFSRMGRWRCAWCCRALGIPVGRGTPLNQEWWATPRNGGWRVQRRT